MATSVITAEASIAQYNRGPIPSIFSPPNSCLSTFTSVPQLGGLYFGHGGRQLYWDPSCYPAATSTQTPANTDALWNLYYYSPAVSCPSGWSTAGTAKGTFGGVSDTYLTLRSDTTAVLCCPSGFTGLDYNHQYGYSYPAGQNTIAYKAPSTNLNGNWDIPSALSTVIHAVTGTGDWTVFGDGIPIWFQASDQVAFTASKTSSTTSSPTGTSLPSSPSSTNFIPPPKPTPSGLSTGAKVGIGVGVAVVVLGLAAIIAFVAFKRRQRTAHQGLQHQELDNNVLKHELAGQSQQPVHELYSDNAKPTIHELHDQR